MTWLEPETKGNTPSRRSGHHMVATGKYIHLFGGGLWNDKAKVWIVKYSDMHIFNTGMDTTLNTTI